MPVDVENEIGAFIRGYSPRIPEAIIEGYGIGVLRSFLGSYNRRENLCHSPQSYQGHFRGLGGDALRVAEIEFAMGYPLDRVKHFLRVSASAMLTCIQLRGTLETVEFTTEGGSIDLKTGEIALTPERLVEVTASVDVSMGDPQVGLNAVYCAWLGQDMELARKIARAICFHSDDTEAYGEARIAEMRARIALIQDRREVAEEWAPQTVDALGRGKIVQGCLESDQGMFDAGLRTLLKEYEKHEKCLLKDKGDYFTKKGLPTPPTTYWSMECMGAMLLGLKYGLQHLVKHPYIPEEMLEGCAF